MRLLALIGTVALLAASCGSEGPTATGVGAGTGCEELAGEVADLMVDLAEHASRSDSGLPNYASEVHHPDEFDVWETATVLARGSTELETRVDAAATAQEEAGCKAGFAHDAIKHRLEQALPAGGRADDQNISSQEYEFLNLLAVLVANLEPSERYHVPEGFPPAFPVHPGAELVSNDQPTDDSATATWTIDGPPFREVSEYYNDRLQEVRFGGWNVRSSSSSREFGPDDTSADGREHLEVEGYGFAGQVTITTEPSGNETLVIAELSSRR